MNSTGRTLSLATACAIVLYAFAELQAADIEKGAQRLMRLGRRVQAAEGSVKTLAALKPMSCAKCTDIIVERPVKTVKGATLLITGSVPKERIVRHQCEGCATTLEVVGHGKSKTQVAKHTCTSCGSEGEGCCSTR